MRSHQLQPQRPDGVEWMEIMKASELISILTELQAKHGDLPIVSHGYEDMCEITDIEWNGPDDEYPQGYFWLN
jgi:hypothetical protein